MSQPRPEQQPTHWGYDSITIHGAKNNLAQTLQKIEEFEQAEPDYTGPVRLHIDLDFNPGD